ncbi:MAG TPA: MFS transporter, partial [Stellaceae bacterium]
MTMAVEGTAGKTAAADRSDDRAVPAQGFWGLTGLVCFAHFWSHFFQFLLPSLFPVLKVHYGVGYTGLGVLATAFYLASGLAQTPAGFAVDRFGAPRVLAGGLLLLASSFACIAAAPPFAMLLPLMVAAGLGNSVFHPADYTILGHRIAAARVGRAFALHALSGTLGY